MRNLFWGLILVMFGVMFLLDNLGIADFGYMIHQYWPLILIFWGIVILTRRRWDRVPVSADASPPTATSPLDTDVIHRSDVFGDLTLAVSSQNFKGGSVSTVFGSTFLDLSKAKIAEGNYVFNVHSVFGSTQIVLPPDAAVSISATGVFGDLFVRGDQRRGFSTSLYSVTPNYEGATNRIKISVSNVFGSLKIS
jgi:predicted membrane protein